MDRDGRHSGEAEKDVGLGLTLPLYMSGPSSVGWWAMFITMLADLTAFVCLVFGYFFYWTIHDDFPPDSAPGPGVFWPFGGGAAARRLGADAARPAVEPARQAVAFYSGLGAACCCSRCRRCRTPRRPLGSPVSTRRATSIPRPSGCWCSGGVHARYGLIMQLYCLARRIGRAHDGAPRHRHLRTSVLYWHFAAITVVITVAVIAGFPLVK